ncbi:MAG: alkaline phosphatase D family protein [Bacteroidota bacterium]
MRPFELLAFCIASLYCSLIACKAPPSSTGSKASVSYTPKTLVTEKNVNTIAFGSCNRQDKPQVMWPFIIEQEPDLWIWLSDNIYADTEDMAQMKALYDLQKSHPGYQQLLAQCPVLGIWDDHDYGVNDGGKEYAQKDPSKQLMLDFLEVPSTAAVRQRPGAYQTYTLGEPGKQIKILLLDVRSFRDPLQKNRLGKSRYLAHPNGSILGQAQWEWLDKELSNSEAQVHLLAGGIQMLPREHRFEKWANFPAERQRLLDLLVKTNVPNVVLLSGDRHLAEISKINLPGRLAPIYEITASGLTHSYEAADEVNQYRVGPLVGQKNFGVLRFNWSKEKVQLRAQIRGLNQQLFTEVLLE